MGMFRGFRLKDSKDFTTNNYVDPSMAFDQPMVLANPAVLGVYQLIRWYGDSNDPSCSRRRIFKPVAGTVLVGVGGTVYPPSMWSVGNTTGIVTLEGLLPASPRQPRQSSLRLTPLRWEIACA